MNSTAYKTVKARSLARSKAVVLAGQDIGALPPVRNPVRRAKADGDFRFFCETYFPLLFTLAWSADHLRVIAKIEQAVKHGGLFAMAMPRGSGKTVLSLCAVIWALLTGRQSFVFLIAATAEYATASLDNIKAQLTGNDLLLADYPEAIYPIRCLEGESRRCAGQRYYGKLTHIGWTADEVILPTIPGSRCSGSLIRTAGLLGNIRGSLHVRPDGTSIRPSLVLIDDPQTDQSARSPSQVHERMAVVSGAILNLAGPGKRIAAVMPCTVVRSGDLADQMLNRELHPEWQGERTKLIYSFPTDDKLWAEYAKLRADSQRAGHRGEEATAFYRERREAMDEGAVIAWPARFADDELSAVQHAMNLRLRDEAAFWAEYQNEPMVAGAQETALTPAAVAARFTGQKRGEAPIAATHLTGFIDVHQDILYWAVAAWASDFTGQVIDYGTYPDQKVAYFLRREVRYSLQAENPGAGTKGAIQAALEKLAGQLAGRVWPKAGGGTMRLDRLLIDQGYEPGIVGNVCRKVGGVLMPSKGIGIRAGHRPLASLRRKPGERHGHFWYVPNVSRTSEFAHVVIDTNYWKTFVHEQLSAAPGDVGALTLFGHSAVEHELFAEHLAASETFTITHGHGREVHEWSERPGGVDNHWLDCLVGCAVAASMSGAKLGTEVEPVARRRKSFRLSEARRRASA